MRLIAYRRVSTARQGASGLCLEAKHAAIAAYDHAAAMLLQNYMTVDPGKETILRYSYTQPHVVN